jgi:hypothetical protein
VLYFANANVQGAVRWSEEAILVDM